MTQMKMADPMDDIATQARQGSVAAIIQVLNDKLADAGVRTRAILAEGVLQLLCEAATAEQLEQSTVVARIRQILEGIAPRNIRRVNINSRLVREQQLLWLEEISRDPENLLWSEQIILNKPNLFKQLAQDLKAPKPTKAKPPLPRSTRGDRDQRQFSRGLIRGASLSLLLLLVGWALYDWLGTKLSRQTAEQKSQPAQVAIAPDKTLSSSSASDPFAEAVRLAEQTSAAGKTAQTSAQWLDIAAKWQRASDLMAAVPSSDNRYKTAQNRLALYRQYSDGAQAQAQKRRS